MQLLAVPLMLQPAHVQAIYPDNNVSEPKQGDCAAGACDEVLRHAPSELSHQSTSFVVVAVASIDSLG